VDFLSHAAIVGFVSGAAIVIGLQQMKGLLGIAHFTNKTDVISVMQAIWRSVHQYVRMLFSLNIFLAQSLLNAHTCIYFHRNANLSLRFSILITVESA
jgi:MFS superfamily sulfate permease-like transporter